MSKETKCVVRSNYCVNENNNSFCYNCTRNEKATDTELEDNYKSSLDQVNEIYGFLTGNEIPESVLAKSPKLSNEQAFTVIWFLQEQTHVLPDCIEICQKCDTLFDADREGYYLSDDYELNGKTLPEEYWGHWCDNCVPSVDFTVV